jgi:exodeoxyribonuclease VII large subunit
VAVYTVSQVAAYLRESLEGDPLLADLFVVGEVSNLRVSPAGHSYFTLKDGQAVLNAVMFKNQPGAHLLDDGVVISAHGRMTFYEPRGAANLMVDLAMPQGAGALALELEQLKLRLQAEGLFEPSRKRPLPRFPKVVGVVTSPAGSVFHDIQNVLRRRYPLAELVLAPTPVQGAEAAPRIAAAIEALNRDGRADVIIVARGGGSLEELWPFNEEMVARAIHASRIPVVSGVGHETDVTIADLVADLRAPTPSAAAELAVPSAAALGRELADLAQRGRRAALYQAERQRTQVSALARRLERGLPDVPVWRQRVDDLARSAHTALAHRLALTRRDVGSLEHRLAALDPAATLRRGFSVVQLAPSAQVVTSTAQVSQGQALTITVADGLIPATAGAVPRSKARANNHRQRKPAAAPSTMERLI